MHTDFPIFVDLFAKSIVLDFYNTNHIISRATAYTIYDLLSKR